MPLQIVRTMVEGKWNWARPKIDLVSPDFYAPLWRPDMVARGGRIANGTGICTGSPLHLAVGANTVAVTGLGTFTVYMPEGGSVASGTTTVTGSPVTVSAGIATTITTTGATGNITVTPSNIIRSRDKSNLALTRTGGVWGSQGLTLDGDDYIEATAPALNYTASDFTILMWIYPTTLLGDSRLLFCRGVYQTDGYRFYLTANGKLNLETNQAAAQQTSDTAAGAVIINKWQLGGVTRAGAVGKLWVDAVNVTSVSASHVNPLTSARTLKLFTDDSKANDFFIGITGEVYAVGKDLGQAGINQYRQATRWRYGV